VPLMRQVGKFRYLDGGSFQALELPYEVGEQSMIVFLPKRADGLADLEQALTPAQMTAWLAGLAVQAGDVTLPRFRVTGEFRLKEGCAVLAIPWASSQRRADFSGITTAHRPSLSAVVQKAYVDGNEKSTEAAAATGAILGYESARLSKPAVFRADRPF